MVDCLLCGSSEEDYCDYGPSFAYDKHSKVHRNCLYVSSNLVQRGDINNGISGFLKKDILAEMKRASLLKCCYCRKNGASIGCCQSGCRRSFHFSCGLKNLARYQFYSYYKSYCHKHVGPTIGRPQADQNCAMCLEPVMRKKENFIPVLMLQAPCCRNGWFHKHCVQKYANNAGYFFKCPLCNSSTKFFEVRLWGIFVPKSDATWETEPGAYSDHHVRVVSCTAPDCSASNGPRSDLVNIISCQLCGSNPVHRYCVGSSDTYVCKICSVATTPADDSEDEFEILARRQTSARQDKQEQKRQSCHDKPRARSTDDDDDVPDDDFDSIYEQIKILRRNVGPQSANGPSAPPAATKSPDPASAAQPTEAMGRSMETDGRTTTGSLELSAATECAPTGPSDRRLSTRTRRAPTRARFSLPSIGTVAGSVATRRALAAELEVLMPQVEQQCLTRDAAPPMSGESPKNRRRHQSAANISCVASRTRIRSAAKPKN